ncbi:GGDEF domain-containing protein [Streptomyces drozdowiczii]
MHCFAIQRAGRARKLRQQARECLNRLVVCFTDDHNLNAHDLDPTEQVPSQGGTPKIDPRLVRENHFKQLNDGRGHAAGDAALGTRLAEWAGPRGVVGRLGGDEFAVIARIEPRHQELRLEHLARFMSRPVPYEGGLLPLGVSLGVATPAAVGSVDLPALMRAADAAMYSGKHTGRVVLADRSHAAVPSVNGRRSGRPGTSLTGKAA